jgi:proline iminopeptidase
MNAKRRRVHEKLVALPGVRPIRRPISPDDAEEFDLCYVPGGHKSARRW